MSVIQGNEPSAAPMVIDIVIRWVPSQGQLQVAWPQIDDVAKLGMLEMAKQTLMEQRLKPPSMIATPPPGLKV